MKVSDFGQIKKFIRDYIRLLEDEYSTISEILSFNMDSFSEWERMRMWYIQRLEQIEELLDRSSNFLRIMEDREAMKQTLEQAFKCASAGSNSMYGRDHLAEAEQRIEERVLFLRWIHWKY